MNRLTKRNEKGIAYLAIADSLSKRDQELEGSKPILEGLYAMFQKLAEYEDLEDQGLLIKLPCKVGDKLYCISPSFTEVEDIYLTEENAFSTIRHMNRIVFLTREEAEKALEVGNE